MPDQDYGFVSVYKINMNSELKSHIFEKADEEWLHCIVAHRRRNSFNDIEMEMAEYDVIIGKIADHSENQIPNRAL